MKFTGDENIREVGNEVEPKYKCDCSKEHMKEALISIGKKEIEDIINTDEEAEKYVILAIKNINLIKMNYKR